jgi:hypothetical protein
MVACLDCGRLREECALAFAEYQSCKDELAQTRKKDKEFTARRRALAGCGKTTARPKMLSARLPTSMRCAARMNSRRDSNN